MAEVIEKEIATTDMFDQHGHQILTGEKYLVINYLNLKNDTGRKYVRYERTKHPLFFVSTEVFVHLTEIFATNLELSEDLKMNITEYHSLMSEAL